MLDKTQKKNLKAKAHALKPVVMIGQNGLTKAVMAEIETALGFHELIKIKLGSGEKADRKKIIQSICADTKCELIQEIGHTGSFFRRNTDNPKIEI